MLENGKNNDESDEKERLGRRRGEEGTKEKADERTMVAGLASSLFVVELMTGIKESEDYRDPCSPSTLHPSREFCGNLIPFGLKSPDKTETLQLN